MYKKMLFFQPRILQKKILSKVGVMLVNFVSRILHKILCYAPVVIILLFLIPQDRLDFLIHLD